MEKLNFREVKRVGLGQVLLKHFGVQWPRQVQTSLSEIPMSQRQEKI